MMDSNPCQLVSYCVVHWDVCAGKHRSTQVQLGAHTRQGTALEWEIRWLQADLEATISFTRERAREVRK
jgi:hypothetical protein